MDNYILLEQLSHIYHNQTNNIAKLQAIQCIHSLTDLILSENIDNTLDKDLIINYAVSIIDKFSDFYILQKEKNSKIEQSTFKFIEQYSLANKELETVDAQQTVIPTVDQNCADRYSNAFNSSDDIDINVIYNGFEYEIQFPIDKTNSGEFIANPVIDLHSGFKYRFHINASGHPLAIQISSAPFSSGNLLADTQPTDNGTISVDVSKSGIYQNGIKYPQLYYVCANAGGSNHYSSFANLELTIVGTNDIPNIELNNNNQNFNEEIDASSQTIRASGTLIIEDLDFQDSLTPIITANSTFGTLSSVSNLIIDSILSSGNNINLNWTYISPPVDIDFLNSRTTIPISYRIKINDGHTDSNTETLYINIVGTNDAPVIVSGGNISGYVIYDPSNTNILSYTGNFSIADPDIGDSYSATYSSSDAVYGTFNVGIVNKQVTWVFSVDPAILESLNSNSIVNQTYLISVIDQDNSIVTQLVNITIYGIDAYGGLSILSSTTIDETNSPLIASGSIPIPALLTLDDDIDLGVTAIFSGYMDGITVTTGMVENMLTLTPNTGDNIINWIFNSSPEAFNYLRENDQLHIRYSINTSNNNEGNTINIVPGFKARLVPLRPEAILSSGTHDHINEDYWSDDVDIPLKYGGLNDIKAIANYDSDCWDLYNFNYTVEGLFGSTEEEANTRIPLHPLQKTYVPQFEQYNSPRYEKALYSSALYKIDNKRTQLKIGHSPNAFFGFGSGEYKNYDSLGDIDPFVFSTKWPAEKVIVSLDKTFTPEDNDVYPTGNNINFGIVSSDNYTLIDTNDPIEYRNISLVDIRTNCYPVQTTDIIGTEAFTGYVYSTELRPLGPTVDSNNSIVEGDQVGLMSSGTELYSTFLVNLIVQNRQWHRDAGHAYINQKLNFQNVRGEYEIIDVTEIGNSTALWGNIPWSNGSFFPNNTIDKIAGVRGQITINPCPCGEDLDNDGLADPSDCGCYSAGAGNFRNNMNFLPGTDISDLKVGMYIRGPYVPYGTTILSIDQPNTVTDPIYGTCGPYITISTNVDDTNPVTGGNFGECTNYFTYSFYDIPTTVSASIDMLYPLRSNRGQVYEYGLWIPLFSTFIPLFYSYQYHEDWNDVKAQTSPFLVRGAIKILKRSPLMFPTQFFGSSGWTLSNWSKCYRPVSKAAIEPKLGLPNSVGNYTYSEIDCNGLYPFYNYGPVECGLLCPQESDPCCVICGLFNPCLPEDIVDYEGRSFYNLPSGIIQYGSAFYWTFLTLASGTGHEGNTIFPTGVVPDPIGRPLIDGDDGSHGNLLGYIDPAVEPIKNYNNNQRPNSLLSFFDSKASAINAPSSDDPFYVYEPHGYAHFLILIRGKKGLFKYFPLFPILIQPSDPDYSFYFTYIRGGPIASGGWCDPIYPIDYSVANFNVNTKLNNLHINISKDIEHNYPESGLFENSLSNTVEFSGILLPPISGTELNSKILLYPISEHLIEHDEVYPPFKETVNKKRVTIRSNVDVGDPLAPYCYETPEEVSFCGDGSDISKNTEYNQRRRTKQFLAGYEAFSINNCCYPYSYYPKNTCECFVSNFDSDQASNAVYNKLGIPLPNPTDPLSATNLHMGWKRIKEGLQVVYGYSSEANFYAEFTVNAPGGSSPCDTAYSYAAYGEIDFNSDTCCDLPASSACPYFTYNLFEASIIDNARSNEGISSTTLPVSYAYPASSLRGARVIGASITCILEWYPVDTNSEGNNLFVRVKTIYTLPSLFSNTEFDEYLANNPLFLDSIYNEDNDCEFIEGDKNSQNSALWYTDYLRTYGCCQSDPSVWYISNPDPIEIVSEWQKIECDSTSLGTDFTISGEGINGTLTIQGDCLAAFLLTIGNGCQGYGPTEILGG